MPLCALIARYSKFTPQIVSTEKSHRSSSSRNVSCTSSDPRLSAYCTIFLYAINSIQMAHNLSAPALETVLDTFTPSTVPELTCGSSKVSLKRVLPVHSSNILRRSCSECSDESRRHGFQFLCCSHRFDVGDILSSAINLPHILHSCSNCVRSRGSVP